MMWLRKLLYFLGGCLYALLAVLLAIVFIPALFAVGFLFLSVCIFNVTFYKVVTMWSFNTAMTLVTFFMGKAAASFRDSENALL